MEVSNTSWKNKEIIDNPSRKGLRSLTIRTLSYKRKNKISELGMILTGSHTLSHRKPILHPR